MSALQLQTVDCCPPTSSRFTKIWRATLEEESGRSHQTNYGIFKERPLWEITHSHWLRALLSTAKPYSLPALSIVALLTRNNYIFFFFLSTRVQFSSPYQTVPVCYIHSAETRMHQNLRATSNAMFRAKWTIRKCWQSPIGCGNHRGLSMKIFHLKSVKNLELSSSRMLSMLSISGYWSRLPRD